MQPEAREERDQNQEVTRKRHSGVLTEGRRWLVLTESKGEEGVGFTHSCGTPVLGKQVYLSVHNGPFPLSGLGRVRVETVPYCPFCEDEPQGSGFLTPGRGGVTILTIF